MPDRLPDHPGRLKLGQRLRRKYALTTDSLRIGRLTVEFTRVTDPTVVLDQTIAAEARGQPQRMPYWAELWESAVAVAEWLLQHVEERRPGPQPDHALATTREVARLTGTAPARRPCPAGQRVLDLGCGMGLAGTVAAAIGFDVLLADIEPDALLFAKLNAWPWRGRARTRRLNWQTDSLANRFDLILGADVLYDRRQWEPLEAFWQRHLTIGGRVVLGEPKRASAGPFPQWITERGWNIDIAERMLQPHSKAIRLFVLDRRFSNQPPQ